MRYPPLLIAMFLVMLLKPFTEHFRSFDLPGGLLRLIVFLTLIYAFRHALRFAICLSVLLAISLTLRFASDHWLLANLEIIGQGAGLIALILVIEVDPVS
jgi:hypothetical protein